jgi:hypothetical protein
MDATTINAIQQFYDSAWEKLVFLVAAAFGLIGIGGPIIVQIFQNQKIKSREDEILRSLTQKIEMDMNKKLDQLSEKQNRALEEKLDTVENRLAGGIYMVQGNVSSGAKAASSYIRAMISLLKCDDEFNLQKVFGSYDGIESSLNVGQLLEAINSKESIIELVKELSKRNATGRHTLRINSLKQKYQQVFSDYAVTNKATDETPIEG